MLKILLPRLAALLLFTSIIEAAPPPLKGPDLAKPLTLDLPAEPDEVVLAGSGRNLAFAFTARKEIAVVDVSKGEIIKTLALPSEDSRVVGTLTRLFIYHPATRSLQAYKLATLAEDGKPKPLPKAMPADAVGSIVAAPAVDGLLVMTFPKSKTTIAYNPFDAKGGFSMLSWTHFGPNNAHGPAELRISMNGSLLLGYGGGYAGLDAATIRGGRTERTDDHYQYGPVEWAMPSAEGQFIYTAHGHLTRTMTFVAGEKKNEPYAFPGIDCNFYFTAGGKSPYTTTKSKGDSPPRHGSGKLPKLELFSADHQKLAALETGNLDVAMDLPPEKRVFYYSAANMVVTVGGYLKRTVKWQALDVKAELEKAGGVYLVASSLPHPAVRNANYSLPIHVLAKGPATIKLDRGQPGMKIVDNALVWDVPGPIREKEVEYHLSISDAAGHKLLHSGRIIVQPPGG